MIELRTGETWNGVLESIDNYMNVHLVDAIRTSRDGSTFHKVPAVHLRGAHLKYFRVDEDALEAALEQERTLAQQKGLRGPAPLKHKAPADKVGLGRGGGRGRGGRGRGDGGRGRGRGGPAPRSRGRGRGRGSSAE